MGAHKLVERIADQPDDDTETDRDARGLRGRKLTRVDAPKHKTDGKESQAKRRLQFSEPA